MFAKDKGYGLEVTWEENNQAFYFFLQDNIHFLHLSGGGNRNKWLCPLLKTLLSDPAFQGKWGESHSLILLSLTTTQYSTKFRGKIVF